MDRYEGPLRWSYYSYHNLFSRVHRVMRMDLEAPGLPAVEVARYKTREQAERKLEEFQDIKRTVERNREAKKMADTGNQFYGNYIEWFTPKPARYVLHKDGALGSATLYRVEGVTATKVAYFYDEAEAAKAVTLLNG